MVKTLPTIEDITRATIPSTTRRINDEGLIQFEYSDDGFIEYSAPVGHLRRLKLNSVVGVN